MASEILVTKDLTKIFSGVIAVDKVNFNLLKGEIHGLVGENGAGKSTFMRLLDGSHTISEGKIILEGKEVELNSPQSAYKHGIGMVYQELMLLPYQSIAENICISRLIKNNEKIVNWGKVNEIAYNKLKELGVEYDVKAKVRSIGVANQQMVAIARALVSNCKLLILDEPTSALSLNDVEILFSTMRQLKKHGVAMIFVSHRLEEVLRISDRVTVLRDGKKVGTYDISGLSEDRIMELIIGRKVKEKYPKVSTQTLGTILKVENLNIKDKVNNVSFDIKRGEILGIVGSMGSGKTEIGKSLFGAYTREKVIRGIYLENKKILKYSPSKSIKLGIALVTEDRRNEGLILNQSIRFNCSISVLRIISKYGLVSDKNDRRISEDSVKKLNIKCTSIKQKTKYLSGGNQQKVVLAKWLATKMKVIIFDEPTKGIDVGAKIEIYKIINTLVKKGVGVLIFSSEVPEICGIADRILVLSRGKIVYEELRSKTGFKEDIIQRYVLAIGGNNK